MKKVSAAAAKQSRNFSEQKLTIGRDLGERSNYYSILDEAGRIVVDSRVSTSPKAMEAVFGATQVNNFTWLSYHGRRSLRGHRKRFRLTLFSVVL